MTALQEDQTSVDKEVLKQGGRLGVRHFQFFILFLVTILAYGQRTNLSVGIVAMTESKNSNPDFPPHTDWKDQKQLMISSFFMGYICLQIGAGQLAEKFGPKNFLAISITISSVFSCLMPILGEAMGAGGIILCRVFQGLSQGFLYPSLHHLVSQWTPLSERSKVATYIYAGGPLGTVISNIVTGAIADSSWGWPGAFYLYGALGLAWVIFFWFFGSNSPSEHKSISDKERKYIESSVEGLEREKHGKTPWKAIALSLPMWAVLITHAGQNWGFWTLQTEIPSYLSNIFKADSSKNGLLSAGPYLALYILSLILSPISDWIIVRKFATLGTTRKIFNSIGLFVPALSLILLSFIGDSQEALAVTLLVIAVGSNAAVFCGFNVNHIDLSPNFAGTLMGITNSIGNIVSIIAPLSIDWYKSLGYEETDVELWRYVFCVASGIYISCGIFYAIFASGDIQSWNSSEKPNDNVI